jgi:hypothetical protein
VQQADCSAQQVGFDSAAALAAASLVAQQSAVHLSQQPQVQDAGSQAQAPVEQQPQQSQGTLQAQLPVPTTLPTATAPPATKANKDPTMNFNIASNSKRENRVNEPLCLSAEAQRRTDRAGRSAS